MNEAFERSVLQDVLTASLKEQRRARRWGIFFKLLTFSYLILIRQFGHFITSSYLISIDPYPRCTLNFYIIRSQNYINIIIYLFEHFLR